MIEKPGAQPAGLRQRMSGSDVLLILSAATDANQRMIGAEKLVMMTPGARVVLVWRAHLVDCDVLPDAADQGRIRAVIVYPGEAGSRQRMRLNAPKRDPFGPPRRRRTIARSEQCALTTLH